MDAKLKEGCWNCKFFNGDDFARLQCNHMKFDCRRHAPVFLGKIHTDRDDESVGWPKTYNSDWCGDWQQDWNFTDRNNPKE